MRIIEAGHYYQAHGPTEFSKLGWGILVRLLTEEDKALLWIDDVHSLKDVPKQEKKMDVVEFDPRTHFRLLESAMVPYARKIFDRLMLLPKRKKPRKRKDGGWSLNGDIRLFWPDGMPTCVMLDAGLSLWKLEQGFKVGINILPAFYGEQQQSLLKILGKALPEFDQQVVLFDVEGGYYFMEK
ncbi:hypothetical protein KKH43_00460 [Patescibacteria group bacterium]|nr:hypothetical protein [Patescibacteria group bacterium]